MADGKYSLRILSRLAAETETTAVGGLVWIDSWPVLGPSPVPLAGGLFILLGCELHLGGCHDHRDSNRRTRRKKWLVDNEFVERKNQWDLKHERDEGSGDLIG